MDQLIFMLTSNNGLNFTAVDSTSAYFAVWQCIWSELD